jgi:outer membrane lipoprotein SlyB
MMAEECVVAVYENVENARSAIDKLIASGFPQKNISLVVASLKNEPAAIKKSLELGDESEKDAAIGAGIGAAIGLLGGATVVSLAGMGVVIAGPLGAGAGAIVGGILGAIQGWSVHRDHIPKYEAKVKAGKVLILAHGNNPVQIATAERILQSTRPLEIHLHAAVDDADDPSVNDA